MNISFQRKTDLAIRALGHLSTGDAPLSREHLAIAVETSRAFLAQVMTPLLQAGWVTSERGPGGGYRLSTPTERISLLAVVEAVEGDTVTGRCALREGPCPGTESCPIHEAWVSARNDLMDRLQRVSIAEAIGDSK